jgi:hypothetical protein
MKTDLARFYEEATTPPPTAVAPPTAKAAPAVGEPAAQIIQSQYRRRFTRTPY